MASIEKRLCKKRVSYYVRYRVDGKQVSKLAGYRRTDAEKIKSKIEHELHQGVYQDTPEIKFDEFITKWLSTKKSDVRPRTYIGYEGHVHNKIIPFFGSRKLRSVKVEDVEAFKGFLLESKSMAPATVAKYMLTLKMCLKTALEWGYIGRNPAEFVKKPHIARHEPEFLTPPELSRLISATRKEYKCLMTTAVNTGMRQGEILGLQWDDVDFGKGQIHVRRTYQHGEFLDPKSKASRRIVDLPSSLVQTLKEHQLMQSVEGPNSDLNLVFPNKIGNPIDRKKLESRVFRPALAAAELRTGVNFHSLRHSYASMLIHNGANIKFVQKQLGHANIQITLDTYSHLLPDAGRDAIHKLNSMMFTSADVEAGV